MGNLAYMVRWELSSGNVDVVIGGYSLPAKYVIITIWLIQAIVFGFIVQSMGENKNRNPYNYFWIGFCFGLIGLIYAAGVPKLTPEEAQANEEKIAAERKDKRDTKFDAIILIGGIIALIVLIVLFAKH
nr:MAG TPA: hypothetical protein [Caudoviricetes sp.]